jgi:hypothetical protein
MTRDERTMAKDEGRGVRGKTVSRPSEQRERSSLVLRLFSLSLVKKEAA